MKQYFKKQTTQGSSQHVIRQQRHSYSRHASNLSSSNQQNSQSYLVKPTFRKWQKFQREDQKDQIIKNQEKKEEPIRFERNIEMGGASLDHELKQIKEKLGRILMKANNNQDLDSDEGEKQKDIRNDSGIDDRNGKGLKERSQKTELFTPQNIKVKKVPAKQDKIKEGKKKKESIQKQPHFHQKYDLNLEKLMKIENNKGEIFKSRPKLKNTPHLHQSFQTEPIVRINQSLKSDWRKQVMRRLNQKFQEMNYKRVRDRIATLPEINHSTIEICKPKINYTDCELTVSYKSSPTRSYGYKGILTHVEDREKNEMHIGNREKKKIFEKRLGKKL